MPVPLGVKFVLDDTNANIPTNWSEDTSYAGRYVLGASAGNDGGTNGGQATHTHNLTSHTHSFSAGADANRVDLTLSIVVRGFAAITHTHAAKNSAASAQASGATSNDPPYYEVIFIEPDDALQDIPAGVIGFFDDTDELSAATGWSNYSTLNDKWLKGVAIGGDAGGTGGSLDDHTHTTSHTHANTNSNTGSAGTKGPTDINPPNNACATQTHYHTVSFSTDTAPINNADGLPPYRNLIPATSASDDLPVGIIGLWDSTEASIPNGWERMSAQDDKFLRADSSVATGGSDTHVHTNNGTHTHTGTGSQASAVIYGERLGGFPNGMPSTHTHNAAGWTVGTASPSLAANTSKSNYPLYRTTIFIKFTGATTTPFRTLLGVGI